LRKFANLRVCLFWRKRKSVLTVFEMWFLRL